MCPAPALGRWLRYEARLWILAISPLPLAVILVLAVITEFY